MVKSDKKYCAVGCGIRNYGPDWWHVDQAEFDHIDFTSPYLIDFADNSLELVYASHLISYWSETEIVTLLRAWHRVLRSGGIVRIAVPDFEALNSLYTNLGLPLKDIKGPLAGRWDLNGKEIHHKNFFDNESLSELLIKGGFGTPRLYDWKETIHKDIDDHSRAHWPHDEEEIKTGNFTGKLISLNMQATKW